MGSPRKPREALLFAGLLYGTEDFLQKAKCMLQAELGGIGRETPASLWHSDYYMAELGHSIKRKFLFFGLIDPGEIAEIKLKTNRVESGLSVEGKRKVNIDPGYITPAKLVLASTKDYAHRVYLGRGIYGEATLLWSAKGKTFVPHLYTYLDFMKKENIRVFTEMRGALMEALKTKHRFE
ncbi:MAG: DUF4416 family protein [Nitrospiraceae bacterium]|nr:DUF4416 family protein [Nitrospiraceae bacterium]